MIRNADSRKANINIATTRPATIEPPTTTFNRAAVLTSHLSCDVTKVCKY